MKEVVIVAAVRTPIGSFMGGLSIGSGPKIGCGRHSGSAAKNWAKARRGR
jgi:acetyl-CoA C-acetyltransferase